jgi:hypothetical protein
MGAFGPSRVHMWASPILTCVRGNFSQSAVRLTCCSLADGRSPDLNERGFGVGEWNLGMKAVCVSQSVSLGRENPTAQRALEGACR